ncbi:MAG: outer membrane beta-barrel protein [Myxococcota bacterium]
MMSLLRQLRPLHRAHSAWALATLAGAVGLCASTTAVAEPGEHIQLGSNTELAPDVDVGFQYRSNVTQNAAQPVGGLNLTITPGARLTYENPATKVSLSGDYKIVKYFTGALSNADQFNDFDVTFSGDFLKDRSVGFYLRERPSLVNNNAGNLGNTPFHTRFRNDLSGGLQIRPGPVLQFDLGGSFQYDNIRVPPGSADGGSDSRGLNSRIGGGGVLKSEWKFLPRTSLVLDGDLTRFGWQQNAVSGGGNTVQLPDSTHFRIMPGLRGRLTERVVVVAQLGYGSASYGSGAGATACTTQPDCGDQSKLAGLQRLLAVAQVEYELAEGRSVSIGYRKDFDDVFFSNFMAYHRVYGAVTSDFGTRVSTGATASIRQESYRGEVSRNDVFLDVGGQATYRIREWVSATGGLGYQQRLSASTPNVQYNDVQPRLLMTFSY